MTAFQDQAAAHHHHMQQHVAAMAALAHHHPMHQIIQHRRGTQMDIMQKMRIQPLLIIDFYIKPCN